jgi:glycosyltransferase involved in cell wall biosynthesis
MVIKNLKKYKKVALVHDYLAEYGGAERVLEALHELFPEAPVFVAFLNKKKLGSAWQKFATWDIRQTWMSQLPFITKLHSPYRIFAPKAFADLDLSEYDLVISSSNAYFAKAVRVPNGVHYCYCHTPPRALYGYTTGSNWKKHSLTRWAGEVLNHFLRLIDFEISQESVTHFIANSHETARRITKFYRRGSVVIYPPVDVPDTAPARNAASDKSYFLYVNRLAFAKHPELAVAVATKLSLPLKVVGTGPSLAELKTIAGPTVEFLGFVPDEELSDLYQGARALLYPVEDEDFGIVPVEAMGHGVPVIAHNSGGPQETVLPGKTGVLFDELSSDGLRAAIAEFLKLEKKGMFTAKVLYAHALRFSAERFKQEVLHQLTS